MIRVLIVGLALVVPPSVALADFFIFCPNGSQHRIICGSSASNACPTEDQERSLICGLEAPMQRKYSLDEIDSMRQAVQTLHSPSPLFNGTWTGTSAAQIEDELRTYMANGTSPEELWKRINERQK